MSFRRATHAAALLALAACSTPGIEPVFIEGRAVAYAGDSVIAITLSGSPELVVRHRRRGAVRRLGAGLLSSPAHAQWWNGGWYVSDVQNGKPSIVVLAPEGQLRRRIAVDRLTQTPHQFGILPDGRIILESPNGTLVSLRGDSSAVFAVTDQSSKTGLLIGAVGGVLHAIPGRYLTLYNAFGNIRWRQDWPWASTAFVADLAYDGQGRLHVIAGVPRDNTFVVYTLSTLTGEVLRWSTPGPRATFVVDRLGDIRPDDPKKWEPSA
ncbi:MAG: hypothetical protein HY560_10185 [Gemmatimonadetes bacterium]|nr:hypothetical protein [Gemmatimonadota bacterium]